jgi:hypothetical protein
MVPTKKGKDGAGDKIESLKAGKAVGEAAADDGGDYLDFAEDQKREYKDLLARQSLPDANQAVPRMPPSFEQVSLCAKGGGCRYFFRITAPVNMKMYDDAAPGGIRPAMATIRRCLVGAVKLDSNDPIVMSAMKGLATEAPYGVQECSHWSPLTDEELAAQNERRLAGQRRDQEKEALAQALADEEARARRPAAGPVEDPADEMDDDGPEPDLAAPATAVDLAALRALGEAKGGATVITPEALKILGEAGATLVVPDAPAEPGTASAETD